MSIKKTCAIFFLSLMSQLATAGSIPFSGGSCWVMDAGMLGIRIEHCLNLTNEDADDLHLEITDGSGAGLPTKKLDFNNDFFTDSDKRFGPKVRKNDGKWDGVNGLSDNLSDPLIWGRSEYANGQEINIALVKIDGYWTKGGVRISEVPIPPSISLFLTSMFSFFLNRKFTRKSVSP